MEQPVIDCDNTVDEGQSLIAGQIPNDGSHNELFVDEDHFSIHSDILFLDDIETKSNLSHEEQLELIINKYISHLSSLPDKNLSDQELEDKKRKAVKKICDLKVKLNKLREEEELQGALKERKISQTVDISNDTRLDELSPESVLLYFKRTYTFIKHVGGHKLVPSSDIYENEKRFRSMCRSGQSTPGSIPLSPTTSSTFLSQSQSTLKLYQILNNTTSYISYLTSACANWANSSSHPTNPFANLVCDCCLKKSSKSINDYFIDAFKFGKRSDPLSIPSSGKNNEKNSESSSSNPYLVCIYCFYTIHLNCLNRDIRKCPKLYFDYIDFKSDNLQNCFYFNLTGDYTEDAFKYDTLDLKSKENEIRSNSAIKKSNSKADQNQLRMNRVILKVCPEVGLAKQDFRCVECKIPLSPSPPKSNSKHNISRPRLCDYFGLYFCESCHLGDTAIIPSRVIHNWNFQPQPVSRAALQIISYLRNTAFHFDRPVLFNLVDLNPMLFGLIDELIQIKRLRCELCHIYKYISLCKQPTKPRHWLSVMCQVGQHLLDDQKINYLSFSDICDLKTLFYNLSELENLFIQHITSCESCRGKGFFCELCPNKDDILFPFSPNTTTCSLCYAVYHKNCYYRRNRVCPRCNRIKDRQQRQSMPDPPF